jgi:hypothetical protein
MDLTDLAFGNLRFLLELEKDEIILSNRRNFYKQDEFVQVDNIQELEHTLYFTFNHLLRMGNNHEINFKELLNEIDEAIDKVYENEHFQELLEGDDEFTLLVGDIDHRFRDVKDEFLNKTICNRVMDQFVHFSENVGYFMRVNHLVLMELNGLDDFPDYDEDDVEEEEDDVEEEEDDNTEDDTEGEDDPNLIYSDAEESDDEKKDN